MTVRKDETEKSAKRVRSYHRGRRAEWQAIWWLRLKGYRIVARNFKVPVGEIDLVARRGRTLAMIEVKSRGDLESAAGSISPRQQNRIVRASAVFLQRRPEFADFTVRFDALLLSPGRLPRHLTNAWIQN